MANMSEWKDATTGQFIPGHPGGPGRIKGTLNLRTIAKQKAAENNVDLETVLWAVLAAMITQARGGNVKAAALVFDRICDVDAIPLRITHDGSIATGNGPPEPDTRSLAEYLSGLAGLPEPIRERLLKRVNGVARNGGPKTLDDLLK